MLLSRRSLILASAGAAAPLPSLVPARQATPEAFEPLPPEVWFERLRDGVITTPLFPSDTLSPSIVVWEDSSDRDLIDAIGGLLVQAGPEEDAPLIGVYIVHPTIEQARWNMLIEEADPTMEPVDVLGYAGVWQRWEPTDEEDEGYSLVAVNVGPVIISAVGDGPDSAANTLRALANLAGMLDHLRETVAG